MGLFIEVVGQAPFLFSHFYNWKIFLVVSSKVFLVTTETIVFFVLKKFYIGLLMVLGCTFPLSWIQSPKMIGAQPIVCYIVHISIAELSKKYAYNKYYQWIYFWCSLFTFRKEKTILNDLSKKERKYVFFLYPFLTMFLRIKIQK